MRDLRRYDTITKAISSGTPTLSGLAHTIGAKKIEAYIKLWIIDLDVSLGLKNRLKPLQIDQMAFRIVDKYRSLNIADINLIFNDAKFGEQGEFYDRLTMPTVLKWFKDYFDRRCELVANQSYQRHLQHKTAFSQVPRSSQNGLKTQIRKAVKWQKNQQDLQETKKQIEKAKEKFNDKKQTK